MENSKILDGRELSAKLRARLANDIAEQMRSGRRAPRLQVILIGDNPASKTYVAAKERAAAQCGIESETLLLAASVTQREVEQAIVSLNADDAIDGILLQLPLPPGLDERRLLDLIDPEKDVDGLHPLNQGLLIRGEGRLLPCTPVGALKLIDLAFASDGAVDSLPEISLAGKKAVVIGRSILVGKPLAALLLNRNATVTVLHSKSPQPESVSREADILVAAVGSPLLIGPDWVKPGAVVIDVGINRLSDGKLAGDVDFDRVAPVAGAITPVPGGVGPMTVAILMENTFRAYLCRQ